MKLNVKIKNLSSQLEDCHLEVNRLKDEDKKRERYLDKELKNMKQKDQRIEENNEKKDKMIEELQASVEDLSFKN